MAAQVCSWATVAGLAALACATAVQAADIGVPGTLVLFQHGSRTDGIAYVAADAAVTKGAATDAEQISVRFEMRFGREGPAAGIVVPAGRASGWRTNGAGLAKYVNGKDSDEPSGARLVGIKPGGGLKLFAEAAGVFPIGLTLEHAPEGPVFAAACIVNGTQQFCHCTEFPSCHRQTGADGAETVLSCRDGQKDATCVASRSRCFGSADCVLDDWNGDGMLLVACGGDSNTTEFDKPRWCRMLQGLLDGVTTVPVAWPGTRASNDSGNPRLPLAARVYLEGMLANWPNKPDVVVLAWGTNDIGSHEPAEVVRAINNLVLWLRSKGIVPLVATVPRRFDHRADLDGRIATVNARLAARYGPCLIDFTTITPPDRAWYSDDRHLNAAGQARRAIAAYQALRSAPRACAMESLPAEGRAAETTGE